MAIVRLKKLTFCGLIADKSKALHALQEAGGSHLISMRRQAALIPEEDPKFAEKTLAALKYLNDCANKRHQKLVAPDFDLAEVVDDALNLQSEIRRLTDQREAIAKRIKEIAPWGNFELPDEKLIGGYKLWFYIVSNRAMKKLPTDDLIWQVVCRDNLKCHVVVIAKDEPSPGKMPVPRTHTGSHSLEALKKRLIEVELQLEDKQAERESLTRWIGLMTLHLAQAYDQSVLTAAHEMTLDRAGVFVLQAWVGESDVARFEAFAERNQLALSIADPGPEDSPPTLLKNNALAAGAEDLLSFYQIPAYGSWDPSTIVCWSTAIFFAMILSDAGYAALLLAYLAFKWRRLRDGGAARMRMLILLTLLLSVAWGMAIGSYFGYVVSEHGFLGHFKFLDLDDFDGMMKLSIGVGVAHLTLANLVMAYQRKGRIDAFASLGWAALALGGFALWRAVETGAPWLRQGSYGMLALGAGAILCCSGRQPIRKGSDVVKRLLEGLHGLTDVTKIFGNTLSYMRLFALGLAGASLALTFNKLAAEVYRDVPGLGLLCSILILLLGHSLNILLCLISGVLHGLRLNFIEFFNWSLSEEGYPFKAFGKRGR